MAIAPNPLAYTTTGAKIAAGTMVAVVSIRWVASTTALANDACIIKDSGGNVIFSTLATGADFIDSQRYDPIPMVNGITVDTIANGTVYISYK